jgi:hypothetical protein
MKTIGLFACIRVVPGGEMIERNPAVPGLRGSRLCATAAWCVMSACFVQTAQGGHGPVPLFFVENRGQFDPPPAGTQPFRYMVRGPELTGYFGPNQVTLAMGKSSFRVSFPGANPAPAVEGTDALAARVNFFVGAPSQWKTDLPAYGAVVYRGIFPGVDLIYSISGERLKSDFIVAPGVDPSAIRLRYEGGTVAHLEEGGVLVLRDAAGERPANAWQSQDHFSSGRMEPLGSALAPTTARRLSSSIPCSPTARTWAAAAWTVSLPLPWMAPATHILPDGPLRPTCPPSIPYARRTAVGWTPSWPSSVRAETI